MSIWLNETQFLPFFIQEQIYPIDVVPENPNKKVIDVLKDTSDVSKEISHTITPSVLEIELAPLPKKSSCQVLVLMYYPNGGIPSEIREAFAKIFLALGCPPEKYHLFNVATDDLSQWETHSYLLMGGTGKNIAGLQDYTGLRAKTTKIVHGGLHYLFAEPMDVYTSNPEEKKAFWLFLKSQLEASWN